MHDTRAAWVGCRQDHALAHAGVSRDEVGLAYRLRELVDEGVIGGLAPTALGCMGGIYSVRRAVEELAPSIVDEVLAMSDAGQADVVLLVPV